MFCFININNFRDNKGIKYCQEDVREVLEVQSMVIF